MENDLRPDTSLKKEYSSFENLTESASRYDRLEYLPTRTLLEYINHEDQSVPLAVQKSLPQIEPVVDRVVEKMKDGGRLFYIGSGTSGRLGVLDASECPPTFGVDEDRVIGLIAGGDRALRQAVEQAEDDRDQAWADLQKHHIGSKDFLIGISASGATPYVLGALNKSRAHGVETACITCNPRSPVALAADWPIELLTGPEFVTGSTRMKAGTAQKLALNMISTTVMIRLGRIKGNKMVDMKLSNRKLKNRGIEILISTLSISGDQAAELLDRHKSVRIAMAAFESP